MTAKTARPFCALLLLPLAGCSPDSTAPSPPPTPASVEVPGTLASREWAGTVGAALADELVALVRDSVGRPLAGVPLEWSLSPGGGTLTGAAVRTGDDGRAVARWTLGPAAGEQVATLRVRGIAPLAFTARATPGPPDSLRTATGDEQIGLAAAALPGTLVVVAADRFGNRLPGARVTWHIASGGGSVSADTSVADSAGRASAVWTLGSRPGAVQRLVARLVASGDSTVFVARARAPGPDTSPPRALSLALSEDVLRLAGHGRRITVRARVGDEAAGVRDGGVAAVLRSPSGAEQLGPFLLYSVAGDELDGVYTGSVRVPASAESGEWTIAELRLRDQAGNAATLSAAHLRAGGLPSTLLVLGERPPLVFEPGGSNYLTYSVGHYLQTPTDSVWYAPGELRTVIGSYHLDPHTVREQLTRMYADGQRKLGLMLWFTDLSHDPALAGRAVHGHLVNASGGRLLPVHEANLRAVLRLIQEIGYTEVSFRFAAQGWSNPEQWEHGWDERRYATNWSFITRTKEVVDQEIAGGPVRLLYDLQVELGGITHLGETQRYAVRLWQDWVARYGTAHTVGFSTIAKAELLRMAIHLYDRVGVRPETYALDLYGDEYATLAGIARLLDRLGERRKPVIIQEVFYNDFTTAAELKRARDELGLHLRYVLQWPWRRGSGRAHFDTHYPDEYDAYRPLSNTR